MQLPPSGLAARFNVISGTGRISPSGISSTTSSADANASGEIVSTLVPQRLGMGLAELLDEPFDGTQADDVFFGDRRVGLERVHCPFDKHQLGLYAGGPQGRAEAL